MLKTVIGLSGTAGSGKDLFHYLLSKRINAERFALADELKIELRDTIQKLYGVDILSCSREQKNALRDFLVFHGDYRRKQTNGRYWIDKLQKKINNQADVFKLNGINNQIVCVTDVRYQFYEKDEIYWLKEEMGGILVHIKKYTLDNAGNKIFTAPPNEHEAKNDPLLQKAAHYKIEWPDISGQTENYESGLSEYIDGFVNFLKNSGKI